MNQQQNTSFFSRLFGADRPSRAGVRSVAVFAAVLAALILLNVLVTLLPRAATTLDLTEDKQFSVSADSVAFLKQLKDDVDIYVICANGEMGPTMEAFLSRYEDASSHICLSTLDPLKDTGKMEEFGLSGEDIANSGTYVIAVESEYRYQLLDPTQFSVYYIEGMGEVPALTYLSWINQDPSVLYQMAQYYEQNYGIDIFAAVPYMCSERAITMAIDYVVAPTVPHVYVARGHGEAEFGEYMQTFLTSAALQYDEIDLTSATAIPSDASALLIFAPTQDFTAGEAAMVLSYMEAGGHVMLVTSPDNVAMPNLMSIAESVGLSPIAGVIHEGNANHFEKDATVLKPQLNTSHTITSGGASSGYTPLLPESHGIKMPEKPSANLSTAALFVTSASAYLVNADGSETELGQTAVSAAVENSTTGSKFVWFASQKAFEDSTGKDKNINAMYYFATALFGWQYRDYTPRIQPDAIPMATSQMETEGFSSYLLGALMVVLIPLTCLGIGISIRVRRKTR